MAVESSYVDVLDAFVAILAGVDTEHQPTGTQLYDRMAEAMCRSTSLDRALVMGYDPVERRVSTVGGYAIDHERYAGVPVSLESVDIARTALLEDRVIEAPPPFADRVPVAFLDDADRGPLVCVPLRTPTRFVGLLIGQRHGPVDPLTEAQRDVLWALGKTAALATIARMASAQHARARALEARDRVARDVHDRVIQRLFGVSLALAATEGDLPGADRARCAAEISGALGDLRDALTRPYQEPVPHASLGEELRRRTADLGGVPLTVVGDPDATPKPLEPLVRAVLSEALTNAARHAAPTEVRVELGVEGGAFVLDVFNDGVLRGGAARRSGTTGLGLGLVADEATRYAALFEHGPRGGGGWGVRLTAPVGTRR